MNLTTTNYDAMMATTQFAKRKPHELPDTWEPGRVCAHVLDDGDQCDTILSIYNGYDWCWQHHRHHREEILAERYHLAAA